MFNIDKIAYKNSFNTIHPLEKLSFTFWNLAVIFLASWQVQLFIFIVLLLITVQVAKIPWRSYSQLLLIPMGFIILSLISIVISFSSGTDSFLTSFPIYSFNVGITSQGLLTAGLLFVRSLSAIAAMYFLILTTPFIDLLYVLERLRFPQILLELLTLIYRFIFVFIATARCIYVAQSARLGHLSFRKSISSHSILFANIFEKAILKYKNLAVGMESRGFSGEIKGGWNVNKYLFSKHRLVVVTALQVLLIIIILLVR